MVPVNLLGIEKYLIEILRELIERMKLESRDVNTEGVGEKP